MNPLNFRGPEFLLFYLAYGAVILILVFWLRSRASRPAAPLSASARWAPGTYPGEDDVYPIALLRGGRAEAARALLGRLVAGGALQIDGHLVRPTPDHGPLSPLDQAALRAIGRQATMASAPKEIEQRIGSHLEPIEEELRRHGLLPSLETRRRLRALRTAALVALPGLGLLKMAVALGRGRTNVGLLAILILVYVGLVLIVLKPTAGTSAGKRYLTWLQDAHAGMGARLAKLDRADPVFSREAALAAGIFGLAAVPGLAAIHHELAGQASGAGPRKRHSESSGCGGGDAGSSSGGGGSHGGGAGDGGGGGGDGCGGCGS